MASHFTIAPEDRFPTSTTVGPGPGTGRLDAKPAYISFDHGAKGYSLDLTENSLATTAPIQTDLGISKSFTLGNNAKFLDWAENPGRISVSNWLSGTQGLLLVGLITTLIVRQQKANKAFLRQVSSLPILCTIGPEEMGHRCCWCYMDLMRKLLLMNFLGKPFMHHLHR